jgi:deazaflavin-dependent oxidoreductase (nitroreductase family)
MLGSSLKYRVVQPLEKFVIDPPVKLAWRLGMGPPGDALLETIGRRTGQPRLTPVCDGTEGDTFWLVAQHGRRTDYVRNIQADPRVKVRAGSSSGWRTGTAHILIDDDPLARLRILAQGDFWRRLRHGSLEDEREVTSSGLEIIGTSDAWDLGSPCMATEP